MRQWEQDIAFIALAVFVAAGIMLIGQDQTAQVVAAIKALFVSA
jgi:hypothetical protein